jgi:hypothetical protein
VNIPFFPIEQDTPVAVDLLRDASGIYGIGVPDEASFQNIALRCGVELSRYSSDEPRDLILRPDRFELAKPGTAALQMIVGGFRNGPFNRCLEEYQRKYIHHAALWRAGLSMEHHYKVAGEVRWWSRDKTEQKRNREIFHGLRVLSLSIINRLIGQAFEACADLDAIKMARRFDFRARESLYRAAACSRNALQLMNVFPLAARFLYVGGAHHGLYDEVPSLEARAAAIDLVERGARLRDVAKAIDLPMIFRRIKPVATCHVESFLIKDSRHHHWLQWLPETAPEQRIWLRLVDYAYRRDKDADFAGWVAKNVTEMSGKTLNERGDRVADLLDWVRACRDDYADPLDCMSDRPLKKQLIDRAFSPTMSLKTATGLSAQWHEAIANFEDNDRGPLPEPWIPGAMVGQYEIAPVTSAIDLLHEGRAMHHCVGGYAGRVRAGEVYIYSVRRDGERVATLSLVHGWIGISKQAFCIEQLRGRCDAPVPKPIANAVGSWLSAANRSRTS